jgi:hypothetical protein
MGIENKCITSTSRRVSAWVEPEIQSKTKLALAGRGAVEKCMSKKYDKNHRYIIADLAGRTMQRLELFIGNKITVCVLFFTCCTTNSLAALSDTEDKAICEAATRHEIEWPNKSAFVSHLSTVLGPMASERRFKINTPNAPNITVWDLRSRNGGHAYVVKKHNGNYWLMSFVSMQHLDKSIPFEIGMPLSRKITFENKLKKTLHYRHDCLSYYWRVTTDLKNVVRSVELSTDNF